MNIAYVSNEDYAVHLGVSLYSLLDNSYEDEEVKIYILSMGLSEQSKNRLNFIADAFSRDIEYIEKDDFSDSFEFDINTGKFDTSTMGRLFLAKLLPENVKKIIYLDCDTVVLRSIKKLWDLPLQHGDKSFILAAAQEPTIYSQVKDYLGLDGEEKYFNAGVMLIDLCRWRQENITEKVLEFYRKYDGKLPYNDQDIINGVLRKRIRTLSPQWNFFSNYYYYHYYDLVWASKSFCDIPKQEFEKAKRHPAVIHFAGDDRPWKSGSVNHYNQAYEKYLKLTPWAGQAKEKGSRLYMLFYHVMDMMTYIYPPFRRRLRYMYAAKYLNDFGEKTIPVNEK